MRVHYKNQPVDDDDDNNTNNAIIIIIINCNWVVTRWQRLFYTYVHKNEISNYEI